MDTKILMADATEQSAHASLTQVKANAPNVQVDLK